jgi:hypothetical protein
MEQVINMNPVELNTLITYLNNYLFCTLDKRDFLKLALFLSQFSKEMLSLQAMRDICLKELKECKDCGDGKNPLT